MIAFCVSKNSMFAQKMIPSVFGSAGRTKKQTNLADEEVLRLAIKSLFTQRSALRAVFVYPKQATWSDTKVVRLPEQGQYSQNVSEWEC